MSPDRHEHLGGELVAHLLLDVAALGSAMSISVKPHWSCVLLQMVAEFVQHGELSRR